MPSFAVVLALALPQTAPKPELLRLKPVVGVRNEYRMDLAIAFTQAGVDKGAVKASFLLGERVLKVEGEEITMRRFHKVEGIEGTGEAGALTAGILHTIGGGEYVIRMDHRAATIRIESGSRGFSSNTIDVVLPEAPIAPGGSWESDYGSEKQVRLRQTLRGIATVAGRRVALIDLASIERPGAVLRIGADSLFALDLADGRWLRARAEMEGTESDVGTTMRYEITRTGAPEWATILAAFPKKG